LRFDTGEIEHSVEQHTDAVIGVALTQDDNLLVSGLLFNKTTKQKKEMPVFVFHL